MSKLQAELREILESVRNGSIEVTKTASEKEVAGDTEVSGGLRKLAAVLRSTTSDPSYEDVLKFLED